MGRGSALLDFLRAGSLPVPARSPHTDAAWHPSNNRERAEFLSLPAEGEKARSADTACFLWGEKTGMRTIFVGLISPRQHVQ